MSKLKTISNNLSNTTSAAWNKKRLRLPNFNINKLSNFARILLWLLSENDRKRFIFQMISSIHTINKDSGTLFLVGYLKECHRLLMKQVSGNPEECSTTPRVATRRGLFLIIPGKLRLLIEKKDPSTITLVLSILTVYRIINVPGILKINTITDPFTGVSKTLPL